MFLNYNTSRKLPDTESDNKVYCVAKTHFTDKKVNLTDILYDYSCIDPPAVKRGKVCENSSVELLYSTKII